LNTRGQSQIFVMSQKSQNTKNVMPTHFVILQKFWFVAVLKVLIHAGTTQNGNKQKGGFNF
jgi:hypothetical protein